MRSRNSESESDDSYFCGSDQSDDSNFCGSDQSDVDHMNENKIFPLPQQEPLKKVVKTTPTNRYSEGYVGYDIYISNEDKLELKIAEYQQCCEYIEILDYPSIELFIGKTITQVRYDIIMKDVPKEAIQKWDLMDYLTEDSQIKKEGGYNYLNIVCMELTFKEEERKWYCMVANIHNGYYGHETKVIYNGFDIFQTYL